MRAQQELEECPSQQFMFSVGEEQPNARRGQGREIESEDGLIV